SPTSSGHSHRRTPAPRGPNRPARPKARCKSTDGQRSQALSTSSWLLRKSVRKTRSALRTVAPREKGCQQPFTPPNTPPRREARPRRDRFDQTGRPPGRSLETEGLAKRPRLGEQCLEPLGQARPWGRAAVRHARQLGTRAF